jgi:hypothetical protein
MKNFKLERLRMPKAPTKQPKFGKIIIYDAVKYWIEPKHYGYEIRILDESEEMTSIECHIKKKYRPHDEETFRKR